ncbi:hypothetical protein E4U42_005370 [Claviceps africana]|uniref:Argonaute complex, subunit Arb1 n=1 Tax=Claviceps africana TaxID=83212 RepID=A0A8K0NK40_9HYPO|nr:hypothetical protein E4U42_005370 [Claviceps africana]
MNGPVTEQTSPSHDARHRPGHVPSGEDGAFVEPSEPLASKSSKKKSRKGGRKSMASRGPCALPRNRGTGFEEFFADPPLTPDEAAEERLEIYAPRIQSCIQRFRSRRRLQGHQTLYFNEYLFLGGVDTSQNAFAGLDAKDLGHLTPAERRDATARDTVHAGSAADEQFYNGDAEHWSVDFAGVAAGFFSVSLGLLSGSEDEKLDTGIAVVEHFLRYVLQHDVCSEYQDDVEAAMRVCRQARRELPMLNRFYCDLPGLFNLGAAECSSTADPEDWSLLSFPRPDDMDAKSAFLAACALCGETETLERFASGTLSAVEDHTRTVKVTHVERAPDDLVDKFAALRIQGSSHTIEPVGRLSLEPAVIEDEWEQPDAPALEAGGPLWVYLEHGLLANLLPGMKMEVRLVQLSTGIRFIKSVLRVVPTFYTFLPQQMMKHFKPARENDRAAPSVHDPVLEEADVAQDHE